MQYLTLSYIVLHDLTSYYIILRYIGFHSITFHYISLHCITLFYILSHYYFTFYYIVLHSITFYYILLHCIALYCIIQPIWTQIIRIPHLQWISEMTRWFRGLLSLGPAWFMGERQMLHNSAAWKNGRGRGQRPLF